MSAGQRGWYLEDALVGATLRHPGGRTIDAAEHVQLAWLTHNISPVHGDAHGVRARGWDEPIVLGALTVAIIVGLAAPATGPPRTASAALTAGWRTIALTGAVRPGTTLSATSRVIAVSDEDPDGGRVRRTIVGSDQDGRTIVRIEDDVFAPRRAPGEG